MHISQTQREMCDPQSLSQRRPRSNRCSRKHEDQHVCLTHSSSGVSWVQNGGCFPQRLQLSKHSLPFLLMYSSNDLKFKKKKIKSVSFEAPEQEALRCTHPKWAPTANQVHHECGSQKPSDTRWKGTTKRGGGGKKEMKSVNCHQANKDAPWPGYF